MKKSKQEKWEEYAKLLENQVKMIRLQWKIEITEAEKRGYEKGYDYKLAIYQTPERTLEWVKKEERQAAEKEWLKILEQNKAHYELREKLVIRQVKEDLIEEIKKEIKNGKMWSKKSLLYLLSNLKTQ